MEFDALVFVFGGIPTTNCTMFVQEGLTGEMRLCVVAILISCWPGINSLDLCKASPDYFQALYCS